MNIIIAIAVLLVATILVFLARQRFHQQKLLYLRQHLRPSSSNSLYGDIFAEIFLSDIKATLPTLFISHDNLLLSNFMKITSAFFYILRMAILKRGIDESD